MEAAVLAYRQAWLPGGITSGRPPAVPSRQFGALQMSNEQPCAGRHHGMTPVISRT
jgi:hypothetical protein